MLQILHMFCFRVTLFSSIISPSVKLTNSGARWSKMINAENQYRISIRHTLDEYQIGTMSDLLWNI